MDALKTLKTTETSHYNVAGKNKTTNELIFFEHAGGTIGLRQRNSFSSYKSHVNGKLDSMVWARDTYDARARSGKGSSRYRLGSAKIYPTNLQTEYVAVRVEDFLRFATLKDASEALSKPDSPDLEPAERALLEAIAAEQGLESLSDSPGRLTDVFKGKADDVKGYNFGFSKTADGEDDAEILSSIEWEKDESQSGLNLAEIRSHCETTDDAVLWVKRQSTATREKPLTPEEIKTALRQELERKIEPHIAHALKNLGENIDTVSAAEVASRETETDSFIVETPESETITEPLKIARSLFDAANIKASWQQASEAKPSVVISRAVANIQTKTVPVKTLWALKYAADFLGNLGDKSPLKSEAGKALFTEMIENVPSDYEGIIQAFKQGFENQDDSYWAVVGAPAQNDEEADSDNQQADQKPNQEQAFLGALMSRDETDFWTSLWTKDLPEEGDVLLACYHFTPNPEQVPDADVNSAVLAKLRDKLDTRGRAAISDLAETSVSLLERPEN